MLGELGRVFFSENKPPEGAAHRQTMLLEIKGLFFLKTKPPEGAAHRQTMLVENQVSFFSGNKRYMLQLTEFWRDVKGV